MLYKKEGFDTDFIKDINATNFVDKALSVFRYQYDNNDIYRQFSDAIHIHPSKVKTLQDIPFLPISFFKTHIVSAVSQTEYPLTFASSGTTGEVTSKHYVADADIYRQSLLTGFEQFYGPVNNYAIIALLPSYLERKNASLVHMAQVLMEESKHPANGFYLDEFDKLANVLQELEAQNQPTLLLGVTFALLDFAENHPMSLNETMVMETGGMKGRREEWTRTQVHQFLKQQWGLQHIHSEYGMTELLSQAYALKDGIFQCADTMRVLIRDINDPMEIKTAGNGCLNIIDLANVHSCSFIATEDIGTLQTDGSFEVLGRIDHAALRGCNLMVV